MLPTSSVFTIKIVGTLEEKHETLLVVQGYVYKKEYFIVYESTNLKHSSPRIIISFASLTHFKLWSQEKIQICVQSEQSLKRTLCLISPRQLNNPKALYRNWEIHSPVYVMQKIIDITPSNSTSKMTSDPSRYQLLNRCTSLNTTMFVKYWAIKLMI